MSELLKFNDVCFTYPGGAEALRHISFSMNEGERVALLGLNGSGKSTLQLHTNGLLLPTTGEVVVKGETLSEKTVAKARQTIGMVFQNSDDQLFMPTVEADVAFGPQNMGLGKEEIAARVDKALTDVGMSDFRTRAPFQLSGGQKRMVAIATVLSMTPDLLVLDEPTSSLDYSATDRFVALMESLPHALLMSTHDLALARKLCTRALVMRGGELVFDGPIADLTYPPA